MPNCNGMLTRAPRQRYGDQNYRRILATIRGANQLLRANLRRSYNPYTHGAIGAGALATGIGTYMARNKKRKRQTKLTPNYGGSKGISKGIKTKKRRKYSKKSRMRYRRFENKVKKVMRKNENMGRMLRAIDKTQTVLNNNANQYSLYDAYTLTTTRALTLMDDEFKILGQTDALATRTETYDLSSTSNERMYEMLCKAKLMIEVKNNYNYPLRLTVYYCDCIKSATQAADGQVSSGLQDILTTAVESNKSTQWFPRHAPKFNEHWRTKYMKEVYLCPGEKDVFVTSTKWFKFRPADYATDSQDHQPKFTKLILIRQQGDVAHDAEETGVGYSAGKLDLIQTNDYKFKFTGSNQIKRYYEDNNLDAAPVQMVVSGDVLDAGAA